MPLFNCKGIGGSWRGRRTMTLSSENYMLWERSLILVGQGGDWLKETMAGVRENEAKSK